MKNLKSFLSIILFIFPGFDLISAPEIVRINENTDSVGLFDKFEVSLQVNAGFSNPFDPEEVTLDAMFTSPTGKQWEIPGFYNMSTFNAIWMVRFSPHETGTWEYTITVRDKSGEVKSEKRSFTAIESPYHGPIKIAGNNRYLEYTDGTPFYGVGFWYNDLMTYRNSEGAIKPDELDRLKELGVNFISTFITPIETMGTGLGRYDQHLCHRIDEIFEMCENKDIQLSFNFWFHNFISETVWSHGWQTNPYQLVCDSKDFFISNEAWEYQEKLYRYFIARWGYSRSLAIWFIVDEVNGTDAWRYGDTLAAAEWGKKIHDYFKSNDPYNHPTTGTRSGGIQEWWGEAYDIFDLPGREIYEAQGFPINGEGKISADDTHPLTYSYNNYAGEIRKLWDGWEKPCLIPETGYDHSYYEPSQPGYLAQYHNALWVSLACGSSMTPFWWAHGSFINDNMITRQITNLRIFSDEIPFSKLKNLGPVEATFTNGDAFVMKSDQFVYGWVVNPETDASGETVTISGLNNGKYKLRLYHTWRGQFIQEEELEIRNKTFNFTVPVLKVERGHANYIGEDAAFILESVE
jgi:hypothetical protein